MVDIREWRDIKKVKVINKLEISSIGRVLARHARGGGVVTHISNYIPWW
jgi:hypothetical protein